MVLPIDTVEKSVNADLAIILDDTSWLGGATLSSATWTVATGITVVQTQIIQNKPVLTVSGGVKYKIYRATCKLVASDGGQQEKSVDISVVQR